MALSETSGLILIRNFFLLSSSSSESLEEKNSFPLEAGEWASRTLSSAFTPSPNCFYLKTERILWASSAGCRLKPSSSTSGEAWQREPEEMSAASTPASYFTRINELIDFFFWSGQAASRTSEVRDLHICPSRSLHRSRWAPRWPFSEIKQHQGED